MLLVDTAAAVEEALERACERMCAQVKAVPERVNAKRGQGRMTGEGSVRPNILPLFCLFSLLTDKKANKSCHHVLWALTPPLWMTAWQLPALQFPPPLVPLRR